MTDDTLIKDFERLEQDVMDLETKLQQSEITLQRNEERIEALLRESGQKDEKIRALEREIVTLQQTRQELESRIEELETEAKQRDTKITELEGSLAAKAELSKKRDDLEEALRQEREKTETIVQTLQRWIRKTRRRLRVLTILPPAFGGIFGLVGAIAGLVLGAGIDIATGGVAIGISATFIPLVFLLITVSFGFLIGYIIAWLVILVMRVFGG